VATCNHLRENKGKISEVVVARQILRLGFRVLGKKSPMKYGTQKPNETPIGLGKCCQG
jgi:hypothetical protein